MEEVLIMCSYGGIWESPSIGMEAYVGGCCTIIYVPVNTTYQGLLDQLYSVIGRNVAEYTIKLRCVVSLSPHRSYKPPEPVSTAYISELNQDRDVEWFLKVNVGSGQRAGILTPLFVSWEAPFRNRSSFFPSSGGSNVMAERIIQDPDTIVDPVPEADQGPDRLPDNYSPVRYNEAPICDHFDIDGSNYLERDNQVRVPFASTEVDNNELGGVNLSEHNRHTLDTERPHDSLQCLPPIPSLSNNQYFHQSRSEDGRIVVGRLFTDKSILHRQLAMLAMRRNFQFRVSKSTTVRFEAKCVFEQCKFHFRATRDEERSYWQVRKFIEEHTCPMDELAIGHRQASRRVIGELIKTKFQDPSTIYTPKNIIADIQKEYGVRLSYDQAWRAREYALKLMTGDPVESYNLLPKYCYMLKQTNPSTITHLHKGEQNNFLYLFVAIGSCLKGFQNFIRPVIAIDGTFLKSAYRGTLFVASCVDGNEQIYPLAFGIADSENDQSWEWFLEKLRGALGVVSNIVFISDRHNSIEKAVRHVFPDAVHGLCAHHISRNLQVKFKFKSCKVDRFMAGFWLAVKAYRISEFNEHLDKLNELNPNATKYLVEDIGVQRWSRAHFPSHRYNILTTNITECLNGVLRHARTLPVTSLIEFIRGLLQRWFYERKTSACATSTTLTEWAHHKLEENKELARTMTVLPIDRFRYHVIDGCTNGIVNLTEKTCSCRQFEMDQFPCAHAIAAAGFVSLRVSSLWSTYYSTESLIGAYGEPVNPVGHQSDWILSDDVAINHVAPPIDRPLSGRPRKQRIPSAGEDVRMTKKCSRCQQNGHNRQTCRNPMANSQTR